MRTLYLFSFWHEAQFNKFTPFLRSSIPVVAHTERDYWVWPDRNINYVAYCHWVCLRNREGPASQPLVDHLPLKLLFPEVSLLCLWAAGLFWPPVDVILGLFPLPALPPQANTLSFTLSASTYCHRRGFYHSMICLSDISVVVKQS